MDDAFVGEVNVGLILAEQLAASGEDDRLVGPVVGQLHEEGILAGLILDGLGNLHRLLIGGGDIVPGQAGCLKDVHIAVHHHVGNRQRQADLLAVILRQRQHFGREAPVQLGNGFLGGRQLVHRGRNQLLGDVVEQVVAAHEYVGLFIAGGSVGDHALQQLKVLASLGDNVHLDIRVLSHKFLHALIEDFFIGTAPTVPQGDGGGLLRRRERQAGKTQHEDEHERHDLFHLGTPFYFPSGCPPDQVRLLSALDAGA